MSNVKAPPLFVDGLPELWRVSGYDSDEYPYLFSVEHPTMVHEELLVQVSLLHQPPTWQVVGFHAATAVELEMVGKDQGFRPHSLVASKRPNPRTLSANYLVEFLMLGGEKVAGPPLNGRLIRSLPQVPAQFKLNPEDLEDDSRVHDPESYAAAEHRHMALHMAMETNEGPLPPGWSHLLCPATPMDVLMDIFRTDANRSRQWQMFMEFAGERPTDVAMAAALASEDEFSKNPDYLSHVVKVLTDDTY